MYVTAADCYVGPTFIAYIVAHSYFPPALLPYARIAICMLIFFYDGDNDDDEPKKKQQPDNLGVEPVQTQSVIGVFVCGLCLIRFTSASNFIEKYSNVLVETSKLFFIFGLFEQIAVFFYCLSSMALKPLFFELA